MITIIFIFAFYTLNLIKYTRKQTNGRIIFESNPRNMIAKLKDKGIKYTPGTHIKVSVLSFRNGAGHSLLATNI